MDEIKAIESLGFVMPSVSYILGTILFSIVGYVAYRHGKKMSIPSTKWIGFTLMLYPIAISNVWLLYLIGCGLCAGLYLYRD
jgi:hypothetical protein